MPTLTPVLPAHARLMIEGGTALVDIRETDEFARRRIPGSISIPLSKWSQSGAQLVGSHDAIFTCRSGMRTTGAGEDLAAGTTGVAYVLTGGVDAWEKAGLPMAVDTAAPLEIMRQVQIAAGLLVLCGVALGLAVAPAWLALAGFVGAGLTFAGLSGFCGMARILMLAPWNRRMRGA